MAGEGLGELVDALTTEHQAAQLAAQAPRREHGRFFRRAEPSKPRGACWRRGFATTRSIRQSSTREFWSAQCWGSISAA